MSIPGDFIRDVGKHIQKKHNLQRGDREAWAEWFDQLEFYANLSDIIGEGMDEIVDALEHETQRNHEHDPSKCSGCEKAKTALARARGNKEAPDEGHNR